MTFRAFLAAAALAALCAAPATAAEGDVALVIGNNVYANAPPARTGRRDAELVADALEEAGYDVTLGIDLDRAEMRAAIAAFAGKAEGDANRIVIYYSGHALRTGGASYLAAVDARADSLVDVLFDGVPLDLLLRIAAGAPGRSVVFVDAAQLAGFTPRDFAEPGLADIAPPDGVLVVSAAPPGRAIRRSAHRDSRFARLVAERFLLPDTPVAEALRDARRPTWSAGDVGPDLMLAETAAPSLGDDPGLALQIELAFWRSAERSGRPEDYRAYLERYPNGAFAAIALNRLAGLVEPTPVPAPDVDPDVAAEEALHLRRSQRRSIQAWLTALGHDTKGVDGLFGRNTRTALRIWQRGNGFPVTGYLTGVQLALLERQGRAAIAEEERRAEQARREAETRDNAYWADTGARGSKAGLEAYLGQFPEGLHADEAKAALDAIAAAEAEAAAAEASRRERRAWRRAQRLDTAEEYRDFLARFPDGAFADQALARLDEIERAEDAQAAARRARQQEAALGLGPYDLVSIEQRLAFLGFAPGAQDGVLDSSARQAIAAYQQSRRLTPTGYLDRPTVVGIVQETGGGGRSTGTIGGADVLRGILDALTR